MGFFSKLKFSSSSADRPGASADASEAVTEARAAARRRLIGTTVLLGIGIIAFPLVFESKPRSIPVDIPIDIPAREAVAPLQQPVAKVDARRPETMPASPIDEPVASMPAVALAASAARSAGAPTPASSPKPGLAAAALAAVAAVTHPASAVAAPAPAKPASVAGKPAADDKPAAKPPVKPEAKPEAKPAAKPDAKPAAKPDAKPAAKPDTKPSAAADDGRYVVQIGAFAEVTAAREARLKVEAMGLKTYTQVIESSSGRRIRVRVGPFATKAEADKAAARIKSGGMPSAVLLL